MYIQKTVIFWMFHTLQGEEDWVVFLFIKGENQAVKSQYNKPLPVNVQNIVKDSKTALPYNVCIGNTIQWNNACFYVTA